MSSRAITCEPRLTLEALPGIPVVLPGDDVARLVEDALGRAGIALRDGDVLVIASKVVSRAEGRFVDLQTVLASPRARELAETIGKDERVVELVLRESQDVSRTAPGVLVVRHRLGFIGANASIDLSNAQPPGAAEGSGPWVLLLPVSPDASAERIRRTLSASTGARIGVIVSDSLGRPFRLGTVGAAIGLAGVPALWDRRGEEDIFGRRLEQTVTALADQIAAAADLLAGQAAERRGAILVRGLSFPTDGAHSATELCRAPEQDLYA